MSPPRTEDYSSSKNPKRGWSESRDAVPLPPTATAQHAAGAVLTAADSGRVQRIAPIVDAHVLARAKRRRVAAAARANARRRAAPAPAYC